MFSYSGLTKAQVERLRNEFSIYAVDTGRICVAALNTKNIDVVVRRHRQGAVIGLHGPVCGWGRAGRFLL
jgi:aspartate/tyrosine/aromatic aminotransferase